MQNIKTRFIVNAIFFFLVYTLVFYVVARTLSLVITHDEAYSFYNVKHFWYVETLCTGNTHWFNFLAIKAPILLGLEKASQLRWFSLVSSGIFLTVAYFWIKIIKDIPTKVFAFSLALLNPYLIDYMSLARGYSAGLMFEALSILCFYLAVKLNKRNLTFWSLFFAGMSAIANFNFFYFFVAFSIIYFYRYYFKQRFVFLKNKQFYFDLLFLLGITALVLKALRFITLCSNDIGAYGGEDLVNSVFYGFIDTLIYKNFNVTPGIINMLAYVLFAGLVGASVYGILLNKKHKNILYSLASSVFLIILSLMVFNKWCFGILYPTYRTALLFYPLISLIVIGFTSLVITKRKIKTLILYSFSFILIVNFIMAISLTKTFDYSEQQDSKASFTYLESIGAKKVGIDPFLYGVFRNYYQQTENLKYSFTGECLNLFTPSRPNYSNRNLSDFDYLVLYPPYNLSFYKNNGVKLRVIKYYKNTGTLIVKVWSKN
jgi:hypothetical protein